MSSEVQVREEMARFKGIVKCLMEDAGEALNELEGVCSESPRLIDEYNLLKHYLDYIIRLCGGKA